MGNVQLTLEFCTGLVRCSRSRPVPAAVIPVPAGPVASTPSPVPILLKPVGEKKEIENFIQTVHITRYV